MDNTVRQLLGLLAAAMGTEGGDADDGRETDWDRIFSLAYIHNVIPMIYEASRKKTSFLRLMPEYAEILQKISLKSSMNQMYHTMEFLKVYPELTAGGIHALVVKGIIYRELYPDHYYRSSGDEDVYIQRKDFRKADTILREAGFLCNAETRKSMPKQETIYHNPKSGLIIELHTDLFDPEVTIFRRMNHLFVHAFGNSRPVVVDGITLYTLNHDLQLLFLILHILKHFLGIGVGIRQICDLVMYCNTYGGEINWSRLWRQVSGLGYDVVLLNLFDIGIRYMGLKQEKVVFPQAWSAADIHPEALLEDIMKAGIFGQNPMGQGKTSSMTLQAAAGAGRAKNQCNQLLFILKALFPGKEYMESHYPYCRRCGLFLPAAWLHRAVAYMLSERKPGRAVRGAARSIEIGRRRVELMKEYKIIGA